MEEKDINNEVDTVVEEEDSTVELRESYEEKTEEQFPKKKRKLSKKKIALICVAGFLLLVMIGVGLFFLIGHLLAKKLDVPVLDLKNKAPAFASTFDEGELALIASAMQEDATEQTIKQAIAMIYKEANQNKIATAQAITILQGDGGASIKIGTVTASGTMAVRGIKVQAGNEFYYQKAAPVTNCKPDSVVDIIRSKLNQQERAYTNGEDEFLLTYDQSTKSSALKGDAAQIKIDDPMTTTVPFIPVGVPSSAKIKSFTKAKFYSVGHYLEDPREITNFKIVEDYIVLKPLAEGQSYIEYNEEEGYYTCRFSLLIEGEGHDDCVDKARDYLRVSANSTDLEYGKFDVTLEVWSNGYFKKMHDEEQWKGTSDGTPTTSTSWYESITYYDFDESLFTEADAKAYKGENWAAKIIAHYHDEIKK